MFSSANIVTSFTIVLVVNFTSIYGMQRKECGSLDIRFHEDLEKLKNCTAVLGNLDISFYNQKFYGIYPKSVANWTFPLREVTGRLFIYELPMVKSLGSMFPNLTVIRGQKLFSNYALVLYNTELEELSLRNLLKISRGSVRVDGTNEKLCLPKIDWDRIIVNGKLVIGSDKLSRNCDHMDFTRCKSCEEDHMCWRNFACQRFDTSFKVKGRRKCHELCLGDCEKPNTSAGECYVCKDISEDGVCVEQCSSNRYLTVDTRRCVTAVECAKFGRTTYQNMCLNGCPSSFEAQEVTNESGNTTRECTKCLNKCSKKCVAGMISRIAHLESLGIDCTVITSDLVIHFHDDVSNITEELQTYLGEVEEIGGILKIFRSSPITSLTFLNKLKIVGSNTNQTTVVEIYENQNLQKMFDWRSRGNLRLQLPPTGVMKIHNNHLLCLKEIAEFQNKLSRDGTNHSDILQGGGKCRSVKINTRFDVTSHDSATIYWEDVNPPNGTYLIYYVSVASPEHVDKRMWFERDSCSSFGWQQTLIETRVRENHSDRMLEYKLTNLHQWTNYAFFVQTYQSSPIEISKTSHEAYDNVDDYISFVKTFRTHMNIPMRVKNLETVVKTSTKIKITWDLVENEASGIDYIQIFTIEVPFDVASVNQRNYCQFPLKDESQVVHHQRSIKAEKDCCKQCCEDNDDVDKEDDEFELELIKLSESKPKKTRLDPEVEILNMYGNIFMKNFIEGNISTFTAQNLKPFTMYRFHVFACTNDMKCSNYELLSDITEPDINGDYDQIVLKPTSTVFESEHFHFRFKEPEMVNGAITNYITEISALNNNSYKFLFAECMTKHQVEKNGMKFSIERLTNPGFYVFRVAAMSLAGQGHFTDYHEFEIIPPSHKFSRGWIILGFVITLVIVSVITVSIYYRHKIITLIRRHDDTVHLMDDIAPVDFEHVALHHTSEEEDGCPKNKKTSSFPFGREHISMVN